MIASAAQALHARFDARGLDETARHVYDSLKKVERWVEDHDYQAYEPFDGLSSPLAGLTGDHLLMGQLLQQIGRQSPINFRPILGVKPLPSTKGRGYMAAGYLTLYRLTGDDDYRSKAVRCLEWLMAHKSPKFAEYSWGNHFDYAGRGGRYSRDESIIVWTSLIGQAFLDGFELLGERRFLDVAESVCRWIMALPKLRTDSGSCLSYYMIRPAFVHNASMLGAAMLARTWRHSKQPAFLELASSAMEYSCTRQCPDGSWFYGEEPKYHWVDNFHTGYNLDSLKCYVDNTGDARWAPQLARGFEYFKTTFFEESGRPKYYHNRAQPIDIQCASQAVETLVKFADSGSDVLPLALKVAGWTIANMQDRTGYFYYRKYPLITAKIPMLHWGQATMFLALALLLERCEPPGVDRV